MFQCDLFGHKSKDTFGLRLPNITAQVYFLFCFQVKIWFQNRRTKWKKVEKVTSAEVAEFKNLSKSPEDRKLQDINPTTNPSTCSYTLPAPSTTNYDQLSAPQSLSPDRSVATCYPSSNVSSRPSSYPITQPSSNPSSHNSSHPQTHPSHNLHKSPHLPSPRSSHLPSQEGPITITHMVLHNYLDPTQESITIHKTTTKILCDKIKKSKRLSNQTSNLNNNNIEPTEDLETKITISKITNNLLNTDIKEEIDGSVKSNNLETRDELSSSKDNIDV